jgi:hypothetical protein
MSRRREKLSVRTATPREMPFLLAVDAEDSWGPELAGLAFVAFMSVAIRINALLATRRSDGLAAGDHVSMIQHPCSVPRPERTKGLS